MVHFKVLSSSVGKSFSSRDLIIDTLGSEWPLSVKEIYYRLQKEHNLDITYQAVHKCIQELENEKVLSKNGKKFSLSKSWIKNLKDFSLDLEKRYFNNNQSYEIDPNYEGTVTLKFDDYSVFAVTLADIFYKKSLIGKSKPILTGVLNHGLWPLRFNFADFTLLYKAIKGNSLSSCIIKNELPFDKWISKQYERVGFNQIIGQWPEGYDNKLVDIAAHGNSVIKTYYSKESMKNMDKIYGRIHDVRDLFTVYAKGIPDKERIKVTIKFTKDPELASVLREQVLTYFKENKK